MVLMTPNTQTAIPLNEINQMIADQRGVSVEDLAVSSGEEPSKPVKKKKDPVAPDTPEVTAAKLRSEADSLYKQAKILREQAELLVPTLKKKAKDTVEE